MSGPLYTVTRARVAIDTASSGAATLVAAQGTGNKIRVVQFWCVCATAVTVQLRSHTTTTNTWGGPAPFGANGGIALPFDEYGWFATTAGEALDIVLGGAVQVSGNLMYIVHS